MLDLHNVPYETVEVNPLNKAEYKPWSDYRKVPVAMVLAPGAEGSGDQINDSAVISEKLLDALQGASGASKELAAFRSAQALEWATWSDKHLAVLLFPNITRSFGESYEAFGYVWDVPHFSRLDKGLNQFIGAFAMWMAQGKIKKKYDIDDERAALKTAITHWLMDGVGQKPFAGGDVPHFGDVCVYGCLKAIDRTAAQKEIIAEAPELAAWYERMTAAVGSTACTSRQ